MARGLCVRREAEVSLQRGWRSVGVGGPRGWRGRLFGFAGVMYRGYSEVRTHTVPRVVLCSQD